MNKKITFLGLTSLLLFPLIAFAIQWPTLGEGTNIQFDTMFDNIFDWMWLLFTFLAIIMFLTAGVLFLTANGDPGKIKTAKGALLWGIIGTIVGIMAFSIPLIIQYALGV